MSNQNQLSIYNDYAFGELTPADVRTVHETIARDCSESQFKFFMALSRTAGANPILSEIHASVFQGKLTVQFGVDFYVRKAKEADGYKGYDVQLVHDNDSFEMFQSRAEDGRYFIEIKEHRFGFPRGNVVGGYAFAYREGFMPFSVIMSVDEVEHYKKSNIGMQQKMWTNNFNDMFKKHMVKRVLKAAFGLTFENESGIEEAAPSVENVPSYERRDITPEPPQAAATETNPRGRTASNKTAPIDVIPEPPKQPQQAADLTPREAFKAAMDSAGIRDAGVLEFVQKNIPGYQEGQKLTDAQFIGLVAIAQQQIAAANDLPEEL